MYHVYFVDEPHAYKITAHRQINPEDVTVTWYGDEEGTDEKEYDNGNMISARVVITVDDEVLFDQLESFVENR